MLRGPLVKSLLQNMTGFGLAYLGRQVPVVPLPVPRNSGTTTPAYATRTVCNYACGPSHAGVGLLHL